MDSVKPEGEWVVINSRWKNYAAVGPVCKETAKRVYYPGQWNAAHEQFTERSEVLFQGPETECRCLAERLTSSAAMRDQEKAAAAERHSDRVNKLVAKATGASNG